MKTNTKAVLSTTRTWEFTEQEIKAMVERRVRGLFSTDIDGELTVEFDDCSQGGIRGVKVTLVTDTEVTDAGPLK